MTGWKYDYNSKIKKPIMLQNEIAQCTGGGGANTKVPDMYGGGGCFRDPKHKSNMYTFVQQRGGCPYFIPNHKSMNGTFVHTFHNKIIKNYKK